MIITISRSIICKPYIDDFPLIAVSCSLLSYLLEFLVRNFPTILFCLEFHSWPDKNSNNNNICWKLTIYQKLYLDYVIILPKPIEGCQ